MSLMITVVSVRHPPPPRPCTTRAAMSQSIFFAQAHRMLPNKNTATANIITHFRPLSEISIEGMANTPMGQNIQDIRYSSIYGNSDLLISFDIYIL
jgi:hypothetical protein